MPLPILNGFVIFVIKKNKNLKIPLEASFNFLSFTLGFGSTSVGKEIFITWWKLGSGGIFLNEFSRWLKR